MRYRYTEYDDRTIARYMVLYNLDKTDAFREFAKYFGVTEKSVASRYYRRKAYIDAYIETLKSLDAVPGNKGNFLSRIWKAVKSMLNISKYL